MAKIKKITAYEILDSRGIPTVAGALELDNGLIVNASVPTAIEPTKYEAFQLRDHDQDNFNGLGVKRTVVNIINNGIAPKLFNVDPTKQIAIDLWLKKADGTKNKSRLGANTTLLISELVAKAGALSLKLPLYLYLNQLYQKNFKESLKIERMPTPIFNMINGGKHAGNNIEIQEFQIICSSAFNFSKSYQIAAEVYQELKKIILFYAANTAVGEEGSFTPSLSTNIDALEIIFEAINKKKLKLGFDLFFGVDVAATNFYKGEHYYLKEVNKPMPNSELIKYLINMTKNYNMLLIEDPFSIDDFTGWKKFLTEIDKEIYVVADDFVSSQIDLLKKVIKEKVCNAVVIKPSQIGTITELFEFINIARQNNIAYIISHRAGETTDDFIADLSVAVQSDFVKFGAPARGERVVKYNRLLQIEEEYFNKR